MPAFLQKTFLALRLTGHPPVGPVLPVLGVAHDEGDAALCTHVRCGQIIGSYSIGALYPFAEMMRLRLLCP